MPGLREISDAYGREVTSSGHLEKKKEAYSLVVLPSGLTLTAEMRRAYRLAMVGTIPLVAPAPDPIQQAENFAIWLREPGSVSTSSRFSIFERGLCFARAELRTGYPFIDGGDGDGHRRWLDSDPFVGDQLRTLGVQITSLPEAAEQDSGLAREAAGRQSLPKYVETARKELSTAAEQLEKTRSEFDEVVKQLHQSRGEFEEVASQVVDVRTKLAGAYARLEELTSLLSKRSRRRE